MDEYILAKYAKKIYGFAYSKTKNEQDAEDLSQEILLDLFRIKVSPADIADMDGYIWRVCRYAWSNFYRREKKHWQVYAMEGLPDLRDDDMTPEEAILEDELYRTLRHKIMHLSTMRRKITILFYYDGLPGDTIAERLGIAPATVRWHLAESKKLLKEQMEMENRIYTPKKLKVYFCGNANDGRLAGLRDDLLVQNIAIACAEKSRTIEELCDTIGCAAAYVEEKLPALLDMGYLRKTGNRLRTTFFIRDAEFVCAVKDYEREALLPLADAVYRVVRAHLDDIRRIGFAGCDADENLLLWDFTTIAAHDYMNRNTPESTAEQTPLRGDGSRHWIDASWCADDILEACEGIDAALYDYIRFSGGIAGCHVGTDKVTLQHFDPPVIDGDRNTGMGLLEQLASAAQQARDGVSEDDGQKMLLTRCINNRCAEMVDGKVKMLVPAFDEAQYAAFRRRFEETVLPEIEAAVPETLPADYAAFVSSRLPKDLDPAEKAFAGNRFYMPNAVTYLLYKSGKLSMPAEDEKNAVGTVIWDR